MRLSERMTFDQLYRLSEPKRKVRSLTVNGPPLKIHTFDSQSMWEFNFKASPSTTGLRHHGYIRFFKPSRPKPLQNLEVMTDCDCADFRYRYAWVAKQHGSSTVGPNSMNQALNRAPRITNPTGHPGLCKHILALKDYIYGLYSQFPDTEKQFTPQVMSKMLKYAQDKWVNMPAELEKARVRDQRAAAVRAALNRGQELPPPVSFDEVPEPAGSPAGTPMTPATSPAATPLSAVSPPAAPAGATLRGQVAGRRGRRGPTSTESLVFRSVMKTNPKLSEQVKLTMGTALALLGECDLASYSPELAFSGAGLDGIAPQPTPADAEGNEALSLLRTIADLLQKLVPENPDDEASLDADIPGEDPENDEPVPPRGEEGEEVDGEGEEGEVEPKPRKSHRIPAF